MQAERAALVAEVEGLHVQPQTPDVLHQIQWLNYLIETADTLIKAAQQHPTEEHERQAQEWQQN